MRHARLVWLSLTLFVAGCECAVPIGGDHRDGGGFDARRPLVRLDECGNGLDDDGNGRIDDGCPCARGETQTCFGGPMGANGVGVCARGTQTCEVAGSIEWGDWGVGACVGDVLPTDEACDGVRDDDCDGAIDEGCPCTDDTTRSCGSEFVRAPCSGGEQTCRGGAWSSCEGAIAPSADVCGDGIDNDCDGMIDDQCTCVPVPEQCRDGVDNDCDGVVDEPSCTPDVPRDAGTRIDAGPEVDAGPPPVCGTSEVCDNGIDDDCDGRIDDGCEAGACPCAPGNVVFERSVITSGEVMTFADDAPVMSAWSGHTTMFLHVGNLSADVLVGTFDVYVSRYDEAGTQLGFHAVTVGASNIVNVHALGLAWTGTTFVAMYSIGTTVYLQRISEAGALVGARETVSTATDTGGLAWSGHELGVLYTEGMRGMFRRYDRDLVPVDAAPTALGEPSGALGFRARGVTWLGRRWLARLQAYGVPDSRPTFVLLDGSTAASTFSLPDSTGDYWVPVATDGEGHAMTCATAFRSGYDRSSPTRCYRIDEMTGLLPSPTVIDAGPFENDMVGLFFWRCSYYAVMPGNNDTTPDHPFDVWETGRVVQIGTDGSLLDLPRPPRDAGDPGEPYLLWHFHVRWQSVGYTSGDVLYPTRWHTPYMRAGRMRMSCGG